MVPVIANQLPALAEIFRRHHVVRADVFAEIGLFEPMPVVGDTEIIHRLRQRDPGAVVRYAPGARVIHAEVDSFRM